IPVPRWGRIGARSRRSRSQRARSLNTTQPGSSTSSTSCSVLADSTRGTARGRSDTSPHTIGYEGGTKVTNAQIRRQIVRRYMENGGQLLLQARLGDSAMVALGFSGDCQVHLITKRCPHEPGILTVHHSTPIQNVSAGPRLPSILKSSRMHHGYGVNLGTTSIESVLQHLEDRKSTRLNS